MAEQITKKDLENYQTAVIDAVDSKIDAVDSKIVSLRQDMAAGFEEAKRERDELKESIRNLTNTLDHFLFNKCSVSVLV